MSEIVGWARAARRFLTPRGGQGAWRRAGRVAEARGGGQGAGQGTGAGHERERALGTLEA